MRPSVGLQSNGEVNHNKGDHVMGRGGIIKCSKSKQKSSQGRTSTMRKVRQRMLETYYERNTRMGEKHTDWD